MLNAIVITALLAGLSSGQRIFELVANNKTTKVSTSIAGPTYKFSEFKYTQTTTYRYAESVPSPTTTQTFAPAYSDVGSLIGNVSKTTWGNWDPHATIKPNDTHDPYGQAAWTALWEDASVSGYSWGQYSTTVQPTPIPTSELVLPPSDPFQFPYDNLTFPEGFILGVAGSAAQIEGAAADEGRAPTVMEKTVSGGPPTDFITNENYYLYKQDIARLAAIGVKYYSFSIPQARILPFSFAGTPVNKQALDHYDDLINTVLEYGMLPIVTMSHYDFPLAFQKNPGTSKGLLDAAGPNSPLANQTFVDAFIYYGKILLAHYGDRVPIWISFNQPNSFNSNPVSMRNVIVAHSNLYHFYKDEMKGTGKFGLKFEGRFGVPLNPQNQTDLEAAERYLEFKYRSIGNLLFLGQDYPESYSDTFKNLGMNFSLSQKEIDFAANTSDFLGIDAYTTYVITPAPGGIEACQKNHSNPLWPMCVQTGDIDQHGWQVGYKSQSTSYITPSYLRTSLNYLWNTFKKPVFNTEFGFPEWKEAEKPLVDQLFDLDRSIYYRSFMNAMLEAIHFDNVNVMGSLAWSFSDNWEFGDYGQQFGLQVVNRTTQERYYKKSFFDYVDFFKQRSPWY